MRAFKRISEVNHTEDQPGAALLLDLTATYVIGVAVLISFRTAPFIGNETIVVYYMLAARALFTKAPGAAKPGWQAVFESKSPRIVVWRRNDSFADQVSDRR